MLSKWPIRNKLLIGLAIFLVMVSTLSWSAFYGLYAYRSLVKSLERVTELRLATELSQRVSDLRASLSSISALTPLIDYVPGESPSDKMERARHERNNLLGDAVARSMSEAKFHALAGTEPGPDMPLPDMPQLADLSDDRPRPFTLRDARDDFNQNLAALRFVLHSYQKEVRRNDHQQTRIGTSHREQETVRKIEAALERIDQVNHDEDWLFNEVRVTQLNRELQILHQLAGELPGHLHQSIHDFVDEARGARRSFIVIAWTTSILTAVMLLAIVWLFYKWVFRPLRVLVKGSRKVADGHFDYRIRLETHDEMSELADAMNAMTDRFQAIRDDLDRQVQERTRQVVRSEQLASVGFLAAGVAHEINNPLAAIALCAESLENRTQELLNPQDPDHEVIASYLKMIQHESFRCKEITGKLLDFSRLGDVQRQATDLQELTEGVIEMVGHLGRYHGKHIVFECHEPVIAEVNAQEMKQVVLNLLTNALDSLDFDGTVKVELAAECDQAELIFTDNGCGMTEEVLQHLFEPFFTRRRSGGGTGLGLSITFRIISEHGGQIEVAMPAQAAAPAFA